MTTRLRLLVVVAALAALAAAFSGRLEGAPVEPAVAAPVAPVPAAAPAPPDAGEAASAAPLDVLPRPRVPAGILARAATARALERGPSCEPPEPQQRPEPQPTRCVDEPREAIEIDWNVSRDP